MNLRPYQEQALADIRTAMRSHRRVLLTAPTGSGKGVLVAFMMKEAASRGLTSWLCCHRRELLDQLSAGLWDVGVPHGVIASGRSITEEPIQVASVQTLVRRLGQLAPPNLLVVDEAHHVVAASYRKIAAHCARSWIVGLTATPVRTSGEGLNEMFDALIVGPSVAELTEAGYLSRYRLIGPSPAGAVDVSSVHVRHGDYVAAELEAIVDQGAVIGDAVGHYQRFVAPKSCLVFCVSRKHAHHVEEAYRAAGVNAMYVGGDTPDDVRRKAVADFKAGRLPVITSVEIFSEGVDSPGLRAVQLLRPTQSLGLYLQQVGRGLRIEPGKECCVVLDHVGSCYRHGLVDESREWSLQGRRRKKKTTEKTIALRHCAACFAIFRATLSACPDCGAQAVVQSRVPEQVDGELAEITPEQRALMMKRKKRDVAIAIRDAKTLKDCVLVAMRFGYKAGWGAFQYGRKTGDTSARNIGIAQRIWREEATSNGGT